MPSCSVPDRPKINLKSMAVIPNQGDETSFCAAKSIWVGKSLHPARRPATSTAGGGGSQTIAAILDERRGPPAPNHPYFSQRPSFWEVDPIKAFFKNLVIPLGE